MSMEGPGDYVKLRMTTCSDEEAKGETPKAPEVPPNYGADAGYGELPEGLPTDMNTFFVEHGITGDELHNITKEVDGDYEGFLNKALHQDKTWGIPKKDWHLLATHSRVDLMGPEARRVADDIDKMFKSDMSSDRIRAALMKLSEIVMIKSTDFQVESEEEETWKDVAEGLRDAADRLNGLEV